MAKGDETEWRRQTTVGYVRCAYGEETPAQGASSGRERGYEREWSEKETDLWQEMQKK